MDEANSPSSTQPPRHRLEPRERCETHPWRQASELSRCLLYWIPVDHFPVPEAQRQWLMIFFDRLIKLLMNNFNLRVELFLQFKSIHPTLMHKFQKTAVEFSPILGLSRRPGSPVAAIPTVEDLRPILEGREKFVFDDYVSDYCYWFLDKAERRQRELFFGNGGLTMIFLKPDPSTIASALPFSPALRSQPIFQVIDVDRVHAQMCSLMDGFLAESKRLFGGGLENDVQFDGIPFVLPLLQSSNFFTVPQGDLENWFKLFDVYVNESPVDKGIILATKLSLAQPISEIIRQMETEKFAYPLQ